MVLSANTTHTAIQLIIVEILLQYILYRETEALQKQLQLEKLQLVDTEAFKEFHADNFIISRNLSHIFDCPLAKRTKQDHDSLSAFLSTYEVVKQTQLIYCSKLRTLAKTFFQCFKAPSAYSPSICTDSVTQATRFQSLSGSTVDISSLNSDGSYWSATHNGQSANEHSIDCSDDLSNISSDGLSFRWQ